VRPARQALRWLTAVAAAVALTGCALPGSGRRPSRLTAAEHNDLGVVLERDGDLKLAQRHLEEAVRLQPEDPVVWTNLGNIFRKRGDRIAAVNCYDAALRRQPDYGPAIHNRDRLLAQTD
jgi:Flp pilus assembly protein TadD